MVSRPLSFAVSHRRWSGELLLVLLTGLLLGTGCRKHPLLEGDIHEITVSVLKAGSGSGRFEDLTPGIALSCTMVNGHWNGDPAGRCSTDFHDLGGLGDIALDAYPDPGFEASWSCPSPPLPDTQCSVSGNRVNLHFSTGEPELAVQATLAFTEILGTLRVTTATTGKRHQPSGYSVLLDGSSQGSIGTDESRDFEGLPPGAYAVALEVTGNSCSVQDEPVRNVTVVGNQTREVTFEVFCEFASRAIEVTTSTIGGGEDPDGYTVLVDDVAQGTIEKNETITFGGLVPGDRWVEVANLSGNCSVQGENGRTVTVEEGATAQTTFTINCIPLVASAVIEVTTETTGEDLDSNAYSWTITKLPQDYNGPIGVNETVATTVLGGGSYEVQLWDVDPNCVLDTSTLPNPRTVVVATDETVRTTFAVHCQAWGTLQVTNETTGWDLDPDGYMVDANGGGIGTLLTNASRAFTPFIAGNYDISLRNVAANCAVQGENSQNLDVAWGDPPATAAFSVVCSGIVFQSNRDGFWELYAMNSDGTGVQRLRSTVHTDENPAWSPDRARVAFASDEDGDREIYVLTLADGNVVQVTDNPADDDDPAWSADGESILFASDRDGPEDDLYVMSADGTGAPRRVTTTAAADEDDADWSPVDPQGGGAQWIVFSSDRDVHGDDELYTLDISQNPLPAATQLTFNNVKDDDAVWSPDGTKIAFSRRTNGDNRDIFVMNADGTGEIQLTTNLDDDDDPAWSPDGTRMVFMSNRDGNKEIYVMNANGSGKTRITFHGADDDEPGWRG